MKKHLTILSMILLPLFIYGNNGKIAFANKMEGFSLDGKLNEWKHVDAIPIDLYLGDDANPTKDCKVTFKSAYKNNQIFFAIHINDNSTISDTDLEWHEQDALVLYLNFCHADKQSGLVRVILNQTSLEIQNHEENKDKCHSSFDELNIKHKYTQKNRDAYYEIAINTGLEIENLQTIGLDFHIVDIDKNEASATEVYWGPSNFNKYRMPGYLGDLVFLDDSNVHFCEVSGLVMWQETEISNTPLPQTLNIKSNKSPNFKVAVHPDSLGKFKVRLPVGAFYIVSADKNTTIFEGNGYFNHRRINTFDKVEFEVSHQNKLNIDALKLSTYSPPDYLFQPTGILHHFTEADTSIVDNFIENYKAYYDIPGVSLALIKDDKVVYTKKYGLANPINNSTFRDNSVFQIASVTKSVFSFIVMRLVEKGIIDLDEPLYKYLPFKQIEHNEGYELITARIILSHQSGLPNWAWGGTGGWQHGESADLSFLPGTSYQYSGEGYEYLGRVIEHLTSKSLPDLLIEEFKQPLGIDKFYFTLNDEIEQVTGYYGHHTTLWSGINNTTVGVAHSILTDAETFAKFVCELGLQEHLKAVTYREMFAPLQSVTGFEHPENLYWNQGMGLGFNVQESSFGKAVMHGGNNGDFQGEFVYYLEPKIGFVLFTSSNRGHKLGQELGRFLFYGKQ